MFEGGRIKPSNTNHRKSFGCTKIYGSKSKFTESRDTNAETRFEFVNNNWNLNDCSYILTLKIDVVLISNYFIHAGSRRPSILPVPDMLTSSTLHLPGQESLDHEADESEDEMDDDVPWRSPSEKIAWVITNFHTSFFYLSLNFIFYLNLLRGV